MPKWCESKVLEKKVWADGLFTLTIDGSLVLPFEPGQFLHLALEKDGHLINRPYSVASPHGPAIDFFIVKVPEGELTPLLDQLNPGDPLQVSERAAGSFTLKRTPVSKCLWLMSTGTGLAPYIAMLRDPAIWDRYQKIVVTHGARYLSDLGYEQQLIQLMNERPGRFVYVPAVTREQDPYTLKGRLTALLIDGQLEQKVGCKICPDNSAVMLCGNPDMLDEMEGELLKRGLRRHKSKEPGHIVIERYW